LIDFGDASHTPLPSIIPFNERRDASQSQPNAVAYICAWTSPRFTTQRRNILSPSEGLMILKNWQTSDQKLLLLSADRVKPKVLAGGGKYGPVVKVSSVTPLSLVLTLEGDWQKEEVSLDGASFVGMSQSGVPSNATAAFLEITLPDRKMIGLAEFEE
jgi:hypothetical protein